MKRELFKKVYVDYKPQEYPQETIESVKKCGVSYDKKSEALERASKKVVIGTRLAKQDVKDFFNCLKRCYSGYDFFLSDEKCNELEKKICRKIHFGVSGFFGKVSNRKLTWLIYDSLKDYIQDSHFEIYGGGDSYRFIKRHIAYVSDLVVKKISDSFVVIKGNELFEAGHVFSLEEVDDYLIPTIYIEDSGDFFLLGKYTDEPVSEIIIAGKKLVVHRIRCDFAGVKDEQRLVKKDGYIIANHKSYNLGWNRDLMQEFYEEGKICAKEKAVILNLLGNSGGSSNYPEHFYDGLSGITGTGFEMAVLPDSENIEGNAKSYWVEGDDTQVDESRIYNGALFVLTNKSVASSAEMAVSPAFNLKNAIILGSATSGCSSFGECIMFQLAHSGIMLFCGHKVFHNDKFYEGKGFIPDYWIDDENPLGVVEEYVRKMI